MKHTEPEEIEMRSYNTYINVVDKVKKLKERIFLDTKSLDIIIDGNLQFRKDNSVLIPADKSKIIALDSLKDLEDHINSFHRLVKRALKELEELLKNNSFEEDVVEKLNYRQSQFNELSLVLHIETEFNYEQLKNLNSKLKVKFGDPRIIVEKVILEIY